eukprot:m.374054 g.374054  ORF g.374054 m.374054 type:complete len:357 (+) comp20896_c0_seq2:157-1227(+)
MVQTEHVVAAALLLTSSAFGGSISSRGLDSTSFPFFLDVGMKHDTTYNNTDFSQIVPRVVTDKVVECPHPCGLLPRYNTATKEVVNGGIPQSPNFNLSLHLETLNETFAKYISVDDSRMIDLDFEDWTPTFALLQNTSYYYNASIELVAAKHPTWGPAQIEAEAAKEFSAAAMTLLLKTITYVRKLRPQLRIGMYSYPTRAYWNGYKDPVAGKILRQQNDALFPLWCNVDVIFPSVYQFYNSTGNPGTEKNNKDYVFSNVAEGVRIAKEIPQKCATVSSPPPVYAYTWHRYHSYSGDPNAFVSGQDESMYWEQTLAAGGNGIVLWGYEPTPTNTDAFIHWYSSTFAPLVNAWHPAV